MYSGRVVCRVEMDQTALRFEQRRDGFLQGGMGAQSKGKCLRIRIRRPDYETRCSISRRRHRQEVVNLSSLGVHPPAVNTLRKNRIRSLEHNVTLDFDHAQQRLRLGHGSGEPIENDAFLDHVGLLHAIAHKGNRDFVRKELPLAMYASCLLCGRIAENIPDGQTDGADLLGLLLRLRALAAAWRARQHNPTQRARHLSERVSGQEDAARTALRAVSSRKWRK